jgi:NAD(P)-dependent dehydrogenase (short-subunit alcohol dehydrogenase family)
MSHSRNNLVEITRQSAPVDTTAPYDASWVAGKTILITGGASGFGEGFSRHWAKNGANIVVGDIGDARGRAMIEDLRKTTGNRNHHYIHCDVTNWQSQVDFFKTAVKLSPSGGIDAVVANAGIVDNVMSHCSWNVLGGTIADYVVPIRTPARPRCRRTSATEL